jgi:hypothetical protein
VVYFVSSGGLIQARATSDGASKWEVTLAGPTETDPLLTGDVLLVAVSGSPDVLLAALDPATGAARWTFAPAK